MSTPANPSQPDEPLPVTPPAASSVGDAVSRQTGPGTFSTPGTGEPPSPVPASIEPALPPAADPAGPLSLEAAIRGAAPAPGEHWPTPADGGAPLTPLLTRRWASPRSWSIQTYRQLDGYQALPAALAVEPGRVTELIKSSGLRGRGGAGFPTGLKWSFLPPASTKPSYLVINADEGEPGTCKDIPLLMADPHSLIEGCIITSYAIKAPFCAIYVRGEAVHALRRVANAVEEAKAAGFLGQNILGTGYNLEIVVHAGAGAYICGEETALLDSLEGRRGQPRLKPPFPAVAGLYASPTVVNNVETIASVPAIVMGGSDWYRSMGTEKSPGPKIYSLSGHVTNPGQYEAPMGTTLRQLLVSAGGMLDGIPLKFFTPGGSSTPIFTPAQLDVPLSFDDVAAAGSMLGTTALMCFNETVSVPWAVWKWLEFYKHESCGKCTPCREGTGWLVQILRRIVSGAGTLEDLDTMADAASNIAGRSFCALGDAAATPILSSFKYFRSEFEDLVSGRTPPVVESRLLVGAH
jgi:NADH-quinone oxidoreductase subunit F